jgi:hypothetical protein
MSKQPKRHRPSKDAEEEEEENEPLNPSSRRRANTSGGSAAAARDPRFLEVPRIVTLIRKWQIFLFATGFCPKTA